MSKQQWELVVCVWCVECGVGVGWGVTGNRDGCLAPHETRLCSFKWQVLFRLLPPHSLSCSSTFQITSFPRGSARRRLLLPNYPWAPEMLQLFGDVGPLQSGRCSGSRSWGVWVGERSLIKSFKLPWRGKKRKWNSEVSEEESFNKNVFFLKFYSQMTLISLHSRRWFLTYICLTRTPRGACRTRWTDRSIDHFDLSVWSAD